jgi:decaprenylphospho-beta-D-ribofuranose 2-oxidase
MLNDRNEEFQIPRGAGLSYTPASFGKDKLIRDMCSFDRILEFDESSKIVVVEAGISLKKLLTWSFSKQLFLPVLPGQPEITVGGCVAANVHGKNPYKDGTFMEQVEWIELSHPTLGTKIISRSNEKKIFDATCGGLGLTGIITKVALKLQKLSSEIIILSSKKTESLKNTLEIMKQHTSDDLLYSWNMGSTLFNFGKGIVTSGIFSDDSSSKTLQIKERKSMNSNDRLLPFSLWNTLSSPIINSINQKIQSGKNIVKKDVYSALFPFVGTARMFYGLYGSNGFNEYQVLIKKKYSVEFIDDLTKLIKSEKPSLTILVMKLFNGKQKLLHFSDEGLSIILNLKHCNSTLKFLKKLDDIVISYKALPYIVKDSRLTKEVVEQCYPEYHVFKEILNEIDPKRIFKSELSERMNL